jgi:hypothetical protein
MQEQAEYKPTFTWWLISILLASGIGSGISNYIFSTINTVAQTDAHLKIVEVDTDVIEKASSKNENILRIIVNNQGDKSGIVVSIWVNEKQYDFFQSSHVLGLKEKQNLQYEYAPAGYCPPNDYCEFRVPLNFNKIDHLSLETENNQKISADVSILDSIKLN